MKLFTLKTVIKNIKKVFSLKNNISVILIMSFILVPFGSVQKAQAQSISGYSAGLLPAIMALPQCKDVKRSTKSILIGATVFGNAAINGEDTRSALAEGAAAGGLYYGISSVSDALLNSALDAQQEELRNQISSIRVSDPNANAKLDEILKKQQAIEESTQKNTDNTACVQSVGRLIIKMLLQKLTVSTVNWINSGFDGSPAFLQDPGKFFGDIAKNEILQIGLEVNDPDLFPFGKAWMRNTAAAFNAKFQNNAQYSLNKLMEDTYPSFSAETFYADFSQGGWAAWSAMTQYPANNPLGFQIIADNELSQRLQGTSQSTAEMIHEGLAQASGFLGDQRCVEPDGLTLEQHRQALRESNSDGTCKQWEYVTPGKLISEAATTAINYPNNAYLDVEDLNDAVAAILDALLGQFSSSIMEEGFANLGTEGADGRLIFDYSSVADPYETQVEKDFAPVHLTSSWLQYNPYFDIRTDLNQALIDEQRTYVDKLLEQNKELLSTTDGKDYALNQKTAISNAWGLMPAIYQLDYCIPGPHPGWYADSEKALQAAADTIVPQTPETLEDKTDEAIANMAGLIGPIAGMAVAGSIMASGAILGASLGSFAPVVGTAIGAVVGAIVGGIVSLVIGGGGDNYRQVRLYYATALQTLTGLEANWKDPNDTGAYNIESNQGITQGMFELLRRYADKISKFYDKDNLPTIHIEAAQNYYQLEGYGQMIESNKEKAALLRGTIETLNEIKGKVDDLNNKYFYEDGKVREGKNTDDYERELISEIDAFGRVSKNMVNGDDIAAADNLLKQIKDKTKYVYNNLIKGPYGCEAQLVTSTLSEQVLNTKRMTYPFPIIYDYNRFEREGNSTLPDPWGSTYVNNTESFYNDKLSMGPGFLSYVFFESDNNFGRWDYDGYWESTTPGAAGTNGKWIYNQSNSGKDEGTWTATAGTGGIGVVRFKSNAGSTSGTWGDCEMTGDTSPNWPTNCTNYGEWVSTTGRAKDNGGYWTYDQNWFPFNTVYQETFCSGELKRTSELPRDWCMLPTAGVFPRASTQNSLGRGRGDSKIREPIDSIGGKTLPQDYKEEIREPWTSGQFEAIIGIY